MSAVAAASPQSDVTSHEAYAERLYERHQRAIFGFCLKQLRGREDADDAVQTTFIYALLSLRRGIVPQLELPWLLTIARNVCSTRRRSGMRRGAYETPQDLDSLQDTLASPDRSAGATADELRVALSALPESQRKALLLREWRGLSYDEIGMELGLSQAATEALLFRARQNVAQRLGAGLKTLQGLPVFSFLRDLLQSAAAKTMAVGAGAALAVATLPAAELQSLPSAPAAPAVARSDGATTRTPAAHPPSHLRLPHSAARRDAGNPARASAAATPRPRNSVPSTAVAVAGPTSTPAPATSAPQSAAAATADDAVHSSVDTASDVGQSLGLPPVTIPTVTTPTVTLPVTVDLPAPPAVQVHLP